MSRLVSRVTFVLALAACAAAEAPRGKAGTPGAAQCYSAALGHLARGDCDEAYAALRQANSLRPDYGPYVQLLARLEPLARRGKLRARALATGKDDEVSVERLASHLKKIADDEESRAWLLYCWVTDRITYDLQSFLSGQSSAQDNGVAAVLQTRRAVCDGYSKLYTALGKEMGLEVVSVNGYAKGFGYREGIDYDKLRHAWNAIRVGGKWLMVDSAWGAGSVKDGRFEKKFDDFFFCVRPESLILTHFPMRPQDQFLEPPVGLDQFKTWPKVEVRPLLRCGFEAPALRDRLAHNVRPVEAYPVPFALKVQAPLEGELDVRKAYTIQADSPAVVDMALVHRGKWYHATKRGDTFRCVCRGMEGEVTVAVRPFGQKQYLTVLKYRGTGGR
jgi:hypothetical protein